MTTGNEYVIDAHTLVWFFEGSPKIGPSARAIMQDLQSVLVLPAIALAEACWLIEKGRSIIPSVHDLLSAVKADGRIAIDSLDLDLIERSHQLGWAAEMHDRQTVASALRAAARGASVSVLTTDAAIRAAGLVATVW